MLKQLVTIVLLLLCVAHQPNSDLGRSIVEVSTSHTGERAR